MPKPKSAKYKRIEIISRRLFYLMCAISFIFALIVAILSLNVGADEFIECAITLAEVTAILLFGVSSVFSRYKTRILAYIMMSLSYSIGLLGKQELEDLCRVATDKCQNYPRSIRILRVLLICSFIAQTALAYFIRDALLIADNYFMGRNYQDMEIITNIQKEFIKETYANASNFEQCPQCMKRENLELTYYTCSEDNRCEGCGKKIRNQNQIVVKDEWLNEMAPSKHSSLIND